MCGIVGFVGQGDRRTLQNMRDALTHRGPDAAGEYADEPNRVYLGHRRLSIVDLSHGHQPMVSEDEEHVLVFNGEIYNHPQLKSELSGRGHRYKTDCDSETILHAYREWGFECLERLDGMFAFVIYDKQRGVLFGARDPFGKKPLYYVANESATPQTGQVDFAFASELKGLQAHPAVAGGMTLSMPNVISYLLNDYVVGERCIYDDVRRLPPGTAFTYSVGGVSLPRIDTWRYWAPTLDGATPDANDTPSFEDASNNVLWLFERAVRKRLMSDVPLGAFISGGIDSAAIVGMMSRIMPPQEVQTFCISFKEASFDESYFARMVAKHYGTNHHERRFAAVDMLHRLPHMIESMDEPFADPSILPVAMLSEFARERVTVALGGDGGDEIFVGYDPFKAAGPARWCRRWLPVAVRQKVLEPLTNLLPATDNNLSLNLKVTRFLRGLDAPTAAQTPVWMGAFSLEQLRELLPDYCSTMSYESAYPEAMAAHSRIAENSDSALLPAIDFFQRFYLPDDILLKVDRASMAHSLEVRCPMLDRDLCHYVNSLPTSYKFRLGKTKRILKYLAKKENGLGIPDTIVDRKKKGFGIPIGRWMRCELRASFERSLVHEWPESLEMFDRHYIATLFQRHVDRAADHYKELWALYVLSQWTTASSTLSRPQQAESSYTLA